MSQAMTTPLCRLPIAATLALGLLATACGEASRLKTKCYAGEVASCIQLGDMYAAGQGVERDLARAGEAYSRACDGGASDVCNTLGEMYRQTGALEGGAERAGALFQRACDGGSSAGCLNLGLAFAEHEDFARAVSLYERSCNGGWAAGCQQLGHSYEVGEGVRADAAKAIVLYGQACDADLVDACVSAGTLAMGGAASQAGTPPETLTPAQLGAPSPADPAAAQRFFGRALGLLDEACQAGDDRECAARDRLKTRIAIAQAAGKR